MYPLPKFERNIPLFSLCSNFENLILKAHQILVLVGDIKNQFFFYRATQIIIYISNLFKKLLRNMFFNKSNSFKVFCALYKQLRYCILKYYL